MNHGITGARGWLANAVHYVSSGQGSNSGRDRLTKGNCFQFFASHTAPASHSCTQTHTKIVAHVKYPLSTFAKEKACNGRWYGDTQITRNGSRTIKIFTAATANGRRQTDRLTDRDGDRET